MAVIPHGIILAYRRGFMMHWSMMTGKINTRATDISFDWGFGAFIPYYNFSLQLFSQHQTSLEVTRRETASNSKIPLTIRRAGQAKSDSIRCLGQVLPHCTWNWRRRAAGDQSLVCYGILGPVLDWNNSSGCETELELVRGCCLYHRMDRRHYGLPG